MTKKKKIILIVSIIVGVILIAGGITGGLIIKGLNDYKRKVNAIQIEDIDISELEDGIYSGSCDVNYIKADVKVTVISGKITDIELKHKTDKGKSAEVIIETVKEQQSLKGFGFITGATNSSKVILEAIEQALKSTPQPL